MLCKCKPDGTMEMVEVPAVAMSDNPNLVYSPQFRDFKYAVDKGKGVIVVGVLLPAHAETVKNCVLIM